MTGAHVGKDAHQHVILSVGVGAKYRQTIRDNDRTQDFWSPAAEVDLRLTQFNQPENYRPIFGDFNHLFVDFQSVLDYFGANRASFTYNAANSARQTIGGDWVFEEDVYAGYGLIRHHGERHTIIAGVRYEKTETIANGFTRRSVGGVDQFVPTSRSNSYQDVLPSITALYDITDNLRVRAAWFKAIGRPNPNSVAGQEVINADDSISRPNPDLMPRKGDSYEASLEYYLPDKLGILSLAAFHKKIRDEIYTFTSVETIDGIERNVSQPRNAEGGKVTGLEANVVINRMPFLPGFLSNFGVSGNVTVLDGSITIRDNAELRTLDRLPGQANFLANAAIFYEQGPVRARLSYAHIGKQKTGVDAGDPAADRTEAAFDTLDFQARIRLNDRFEVIGEARNLTNTQRLNLTGPDQDIARDINRFGRQFWLGVAFSL